VTVSLTAALTEVRSRLDEPVAQFWSNTELTSWLNLGAQDIAREAQALWMQVNIPAIPNQQYYRLPLDFLGVHRIDFSVNNSDQVYNLEFQGLKNMDELWGILQHLPSAFPQAYYLWNDTGYQGGQGYFGTYPVVGENGVFICYYYRNAITAVAGTDLLDVTPAYEDLTYEYCVAQAKRKDRDPSWQEAMQMYKDQLQNMFDKTSRFTDQGDQFTSGTPNWPLYLYTDTNNWF
jgi:hypothetical protein